MADPIDLEAARRERHPDYIDRAAFARLLNLLEEEVAAITLGSMAAFGAIDGIAPEVQAHINAIRRVIDGRIDVEDRHGE